MNHYLKIQQICNPHISFFSVRDMHKLGHVIMMAEQYMRLHTAFGSAILCPGEHAQAKRDECDNSLKVNYSNKLCFSCTATYAISATCEKILHAHAISFYPAKF
ncbi:MAG: hypothetical protein JXR91_13900 [Deltaproteobacteria bacterium]|nr:hypothetical protein [Deltaproteobacteria bacterium]